MITNSQFLIQLLVKLYLTRSIVCIQMLFDTYGRDFNMNNSVRVVIGSLNVFATCNAMTFGPLVTVGCNYERLVEMISTEDEDR